MQAVANDRTGVGWQPTVRHVGIVVSSSQGAAAAQSSTESGAEAPGSPQGACGFAPLRLMLCELLPRS